MLIVGDSIYKHFREWKSRNSNTFYESQMLFPYTEEPSAKIKQS